MSCTSTPIRYRPGTMGLPDRSGPAPAPGTPPRNARIAAAPDRLGRVLKYKADRGPVAYVLAMFVPSFFTGHLITRFGVYRIISLGLVILALAGIGGLGGLIGGFTSMPGPPEILAYLGGSYEPARIRATTLLYLLGYNAPEDAILPEDFAWDDEEKKAPH